MITANFRAEYAEIRQRNIRPVPDGSLGEGLLRLGKKIEVSMAPPRINSFGLKGRIDSVMGFGVRIVDAKPGDEAVEVVEFDPGPADNVIPIPPIEPRHDEQ